MTDMQHKPLQLPANRDKLIAWAVAADDGCVSVGGLAAKLGMLTDSSGSELVVAVQERPGLEAIARLVQLARREKGKSPEEFASKIGLDLAELVDIENARGVPEPRVLHLLSIGLKVRYQKLLILAGHKQPRDESLADETLKFAASSGPMDRLSPSEVRALHAFIEALDD